MTAFQVLQDNRGHVCFCHNMHMHMYVTCACSMCMWMCMCMCMCMHIFQLKNKNREFSPRTSTTHNQNYGLSCRLIPAFMRLLRFFAGAGPRAGRYTASSRGREAAGRAGLAAPAFHVHFSLFRRRARRVVVKDVYTLTSRPNASTSNTYITRAQFRPPGASRTPVSRSTSITAAPHVAPRRLVPPPALR